MASYETVTELNQKFLAAAAKGDMAEVEACRNRGADPDQARDNDRRTALHLAALNGHAHVVTYLLKDQCDARLLDEDEKTPLMLAVSKNHKAVVQAYLDCDARVDAEGPWDETTPLTEGATADAAESIGLILKGGVKPDRPDNHGKTALMFAAEKDAVNAFEALVAGGADPTAKTNVGKTALDFAKAAGAVRVLAKLESFFPHYAAEVAAHKEALALVELTEATVLSMTEGAPGRIGLLRPLRLKGPGG